MVDGWLKKNEDFFAGIGREANSEIGNVSSITKKLVDTGAIKIHNPGDTNKYYGGKSMERFLSCKVYQGQFPNEYAVQGEMCDNRKFDLFAPRECVKILHGVEPSKDKPVDGAIRVTVGPEEDDYVLVVLPQPTLENGQMISVKKTQLSSDKE